MDFCFDLENPLPSSHDLSSDNLTALFYNESDHMVSIESLHTLTETHSCTFIIRREIVSLILHFSRTFDNSLSYLSINYLDRFLSVQSIMEIKPWISSLIAVSCVSLALKMTKTEYSFSDIQKDGGLLFNSGSIERMEYLILDSLKWRMRSITPFCFISFFASLFKFQDEPFRQALKARGTEIIFKSQNEAKLLEFKPSIIAASALLCASHELFPLQFPCYMKAILNCSYVNKEKMFKCYNVMQEAVMDGYESILDRQWLSSTSTTSTSESTTTEANAEAMAAAGLWMERDLKRRKIIASGSGNNNTTIQLFTD